MGKNGPHQILPGRASILVSVQRGVLQKGRGYRISAYFVMANLCRRLGLLTRDRKSLQGHERNNTQGSGEEVDLPVNMRLVRLMLRRTIYSEIEKHKLRQNDMIF